MSGSEELGESHKSSAIDVPRDRIDAILADLARLGRSAARRLHEQVVAGYIDAGAEADYLHTAVIETALFEKLDYPALFAEAEERAREELSRLTS